MTQYMLLFSLGPVQPFITQARKTRDLWQGSFLFSALMQVSMEGIESKLIFPSKPVIEKNIPDLPNKYIAIFDTMDQAVTAAQKSEKKIREFWLDICEDVWHEVPGKYAAPDSDTRKQWNEQVKPEHVFEFFYVVVEGDAEHYQDWLRETQFTLDRRKHLRDFAQREEDGEKSTISGQRAAIRGEGKTRKEVQVFWQQVTQKAGLSIRDIDLEGNERLDAIDTVKRFAFKSARFLPRLKLQLNKQQRAFPSTSSIATASYVEQLLTVSKRPEITPALSKWLSETQKLGELMPASIPLLYEKAIQHQADASILECDGDCFFPETFSEARLKKEFHFTDEEKVKREKLAKDGPKALSDLLGITDTLQFSEITNTPSSITRPTPYYALIQMDGDKMGKLINGVGDETEHRSISKALSKFSRECVPDIVQDNYPGRLIYAGGDDVVALAPLARNSSGAEPEQTFSETVLDLVELLQRRYRLIVQNAVKDPERKKLVTASTGIAIAHHYTSLSYVRRVSKEAEQVAKNQYGRNALVVTVLRRSGEQTTVGCHWDYDKLSDENQPVPLFLFFYKHFKDDVLSPKCIFTLLEEAPTLVHLEREAQQSEVKRVLRRQRNPILKEKFPDEELERKASNLVELAKAMDEPVHEGQQLSVELHASGRRYGLVEVLGWLLVMLFLARKEQD